MIIDCISDLHGYRPKLPGGDILVIAGDLTARHTPEEYNDFIIWLNKQSYKVKIFTGGNHDTFLDVRPLPQLLLYDDTTYCILDSQLEIMGINFWASPWTAYFTGMNKRCTAFVVDNERQLGNAWSIIPDDIDFLITHCPPYGIFDTVGDRKTGSMSLLDEVVNRIQPKFHVFGHIHGEGGQTKVLKDTRFINASLLDENYHPVFDITRINLTIDRVDKVGLDG